MTKGKDSLVSEFRELHEEYKDRPRLMLIVFACLALMVAVLCFSAVAACVCGVLLMAAGLPEEKKCSCRPVTSVASKPKVIGASRYRVDRNNMIRKN